MGQISPNPEKIQKPSMGFGRESGSLFLIDEADERSARLAKIAGSRAKEPVAPWSGFLTVWTVGAIATVCVFWWLGLGAVDRGALEIAQRWASPQLDAVVVAITQLGDPAVTWPFVLVIGLYLAVGARAPREAALWIITVGAAASLNTALKFGFGRVRPADLAYEGVSAYSFPSGHATVSLVMYGVLCLLILHSTATWRRTLMIPLLALGGAIALSRVYLGAHWVSDVAASALIASAIVGLAHHTYMRMRRNQIHPGKLMAAVALGLFIFGGLNISRNHGADLERYQTARQSVATTNVREAHEPASQPVGVPSQSAR